MGNLIFDGKGIIGHDLIVKMKRGIEMLLQGFPPITANGTAKESITAITVYGHSTQDGTPSPDNPVPIVSAGDSGEIEAKVYGGNLISSDISSWNSNGWSNAVLQLSDGIKIKTINGWIKVYYDTSEMNGKTLNLSFDYRQIESETTSPITSNAFAVVVQDENVYPKTNNSIFLFQIKSPETVKTHVSVSFIARNYLCLFLRVNTEGQEAGETRAIEVTNIMLNAGNTELTYEPYKTPQSIVLSTPNGLPGIPVTSGGNYTDESGQQWICDEIDLARGKYVKRVKEVQISPDWLVEANDQAEFIETFNSYTQYGAVTDLLKNRSPLCNVLKGGVFDLADTPKCLIGGNYNIYLRVPRNICGNTLTEIKSWVDENPVNVLYILETPIETDLPAEEIAAYKELHTYSPTTTVSNDAAAWMEVGVIME